MRPTLDDARATLRRRFGYPGFRGRQAQAIASVLGGRDTVVILPTGGGKSLCYQIPALLLPGPTVVVSPLISLMQDQVDALGRRDIRATFVNSTLTSDEIRRRLAAVEDGDAKLLYVAPERFEQTRFLERIGRAGVSLLAIDEAHCISAWGHEFRPAYARLARVRERLACPTVALTATATPEVRRDIVRSLGLRRPRVVVQGFDRPNLEWHVIDGRGVREKDALLVRLVRQRPRPGSAIVYAVTRGAVDALAERLIRAGVPAAAYHAGAPSAERKRLQERFMAGHIDVMVATNAFGMGIDKPDVRLVVHHAMPRTLEDYYQEAGRAARDGGPGRCVLLHLRRDRRVHEFFIRRSYPPWRGIERLLDALRAAAGADGRLEPADLERVRSAMPSGDTADAALAALERGGVLRPVPDRRGSAWVRRIASDRRVARELAGDDRAADRTLLHALDAAVGRHALERGAAVPRRALRRAAGSADAATARLDALQAEGILEWRRRARPAYGLSAGRGLDRAAFERRRRIELDKLRAMESYAYTRGCRVRFVLRYFGDRADFDACGRCDRCLDGAAFAAPGRRAPRSRTLARLRERVRGGGA